MCRAPAPGISSAGSGPRWVLRGTQDRANPRAPQPTPPTPRHSPPPRQLPAPLDPTRRRLPLPEAPRSRAPPPGARPRRALTTRGPAQRFLPLPRCHLLPRLLSSAVCARPSCSRICFWHPLGTPKFILAGRCGPGQSYCSSV